MERGLKLRSVSSGVPWKMPQSIRRRLPAASTRYLEPVTVPAAQRKVSLGIGVSLYRRERRSQCVGIQKVLKIKYRREKAKEKPKKSNAEAQSAQRRKSTTNDYILPRWGAAVLRPYREIPHRHECTCCWLVGGRGGCLWLINDLVDFEA